jgi:hypothetical protein
MQPGNFRDSTGTSHSRTHGILDFSGLSALNVDELDTYGFNFICCTCDNWRYSIRFNNQDINTDPAKTDGILIIDVAINGITDGAALVAHILAIAGRNPGGHEFMNFWQCGDNPARLIIASSTINTVPSANSGLLMEGVWTPSGLIVGRSHGDWMYMINDAGTGITITGYHGGDRLVVVPNGILTFSESEKKYEILPVTAIGADAFRTRAGSQVVDVYIPNTVLRIGRRAFSRCTRLVNIRIPDSVSVIEAEAFRGCLKLTNVTISKNIESIGASAFSDCAALRDIYFRSPLPPPIVGASAFWGTGGREVVARAIVPAGSVGNYTGRNGNTWSGLIVTDEDDIGINFDDDSDVIITGRQAVVDNINLPTPQIRYDRGDFQINLTKETITFAWGYEPKAFSIDGGIRWRNVRPAMFHPNNFSRLLNSGFRLSVSNMAIDRNTRTIPKESVVVNFQMDILKRPRAPRMTVQQPRPNRREIPALPWTWYLSESRKITNPISINGIEIGVTAGRTADTRGWGRFSEEPNGVMRMPIQSLSGRTRSVRQWSYMVRTAPRINLIVEGQYPTAVPASRPRRITVRAIPATPPVPPESAVFATIEDVTISGMVGNPFTQQNITINLTGDAFNDIENGFLIDWLNLPLGLGARVVGTVSSGSTSILIELYGNPHPLAISSAPITGTIPGNILQSVNSIDLASNPAALYSINSEPVAVVGNVTVNGRVNTLLSPVNITITLHGDTFMGIMPGDNVNAWILNLPAGLSATVLSETPTNVVISISGIPTVCSSATINVEIPTMRLSASSNQLAVSTNTNARYNISGIATISNGTVNGLAGTAITPQTFTITLTGDTFNNVLAVNADISSWFKDSNILAVNRLPNGLFARVSGVAVSQGDTTVTVEISGTPTAVSNSGIYFIIPAIRLTNGINIRFDGENPAALYDIDRNLDVATGNTYPFALQGTVGQDIGGGAPTGYQLFTLDLHGDLYLTNQLPINMNISSWFSNLPNGITAEIISRTSSTIIIGFKGEPTAASSAQINMTIPAHVLQSGNAKVLNDAQVTYNIIP